MIKKSLILLLIVLIPFTILFGCTGITDFVGVRFVDNEDGTVSDNVNNLMWTHAAEEKLDWEESKKYCTNLDIGNFNDWRLPTKEELLLFIDNGCAPENQPSENCHGRWVSSSFKEIYRFSASMYWSSELSSIRCEPVVCADVLDIDSAKISYAFTDRTYMVAARCVRNIR
jgi:hypothetical protein